MKYRIGEKDFGELAMDIACPISHEILKHPLLCRDGFSYEETAIKEWIKNKGTSPMIGLPLKDLTLRENYNLASCINAYNGLKQRLIKTNDRRKLDAKVPTKEIQLKTIHKEKLEEIMEHYYNTTWSLSHCLKEIEELYNKIPISYSVVENYANITRYAGKYNKSLELINRMKVLCPDSLSPYYTESRVYYEKGERVKGMELLCELKSKYYIENHTLKELKSMMHAYSNLEDSDMNYRLFSAFLQLNNENYLIALEYAKHCLNLQKYNEALAISEKYLKLYPSQPLILRFIAVVYEKLNRKPEAIAANKQFSNITVWRNFKARALYCAATLRDSSEFELIIQELKESYELDTDSDADIYLAAVYAEKKMYDKAEEWIRVCSEKINIMDNAICLRIMAAINKKRKQYDVALKYYIRLCEIDKERIFEYRQKIDTIISYQKTT